MEATDLREIVAEAAAKRSHAADGDYDIDDPYRQGVDAHAVAAKQMDEAVQRIARGLR